MPLVMVISETLPEHIKPLEVAFDKDLHELLVSITIPNTAHKTATSSP